MKFFRFLFIMLLVNVLIIGCLGCGGVNSNNDSDDTTGGGESNKPPVDGGNEDSDEDGDKDNVSKYTINDSGYILIDGEKTSVRIHGYDKTYYGESDVYEVFVDRYPEYDRDKDTWASEILGNRLITEHYYDVINDGKHNFTALKGKIDEVEGGVSFSKSVIQTEKYILPIKEKGFFRITLDAKLSNNGNSGQFFNNDNVVEEGRVYFGTNTGNSFLYLGVNIRGTYFNYGWKVSAAMMEERHLYVVEYDEGEFWLSVDGENRRPLEYLNMKQSSHTAITDSEAASEELRTKLIANQNREYLVLNRMGADQFVMNTVIYDLNILTSAHFDYQEVEEHPLKDSLIYHLGSSITQGHSSGGVAYGEIIRDMSGGRIEKEAVGGTTLAVKSGSNNSYVERLEKFSFAAEDLPDFIVIQLSTNDVAQGIPMGEVAQGFGKGALDNRTVIGAIEYIIARVRERSPNTRIIFYSCPVKASWTGSNSYSKLVSLVMTSIARKWDIQVLDLYNLHYQKRDNVYFADDIHPNNAGYLSIFVPNMLKMLVGY